MGNIDTKTILIGVGVIVAAIYLWQSASSSGSSSGVNISDWVNVLIGGAIFFLGVYYASYGKLPSFSKQ